MSTYLINYDPKSSDFDYTPFFDKIKSYGSWHHPLEYTWFVKVEDFVSANVLYGELKPLLSERDRILIIKVDKVQKQGWLSKSFWNWIDLDD